jgi:diaminohydroxyphosphoribosylaminopyrimidine deaminase/5-amino-6-(5-phosphoribosylamino)uracil reductase
VPVDTIEAVADRIERQVLERGEREIVGSVIGEALMRGLHALDAVAYVRFASVHNSFGDVPHEFMRELEGSSPARCRAAAAWRLAGTTRPGGAARCLRARRPDRRALHAPRARISRPRRLGRTWPNPPVGAVVVRGGRVVGEGYHTRAGAPHAEIEALRAAGEHARGAQMFVTLEPCTHHGRTPPCVEALLATGLSRVVVAVADPNPRVRGRGIRRLRRSGIPVTIGVEAAAAGELLAGFRSRVLRGRPLITLKLAVTLDAGSPRVEAIHAGSPAPRPGAWRTSCARLRRRPRRRRHRYARTSATHLPDRGAARPVRVVVAGRTLDLPVAARVLAPGGPPTLVVAPAGAAARRVQALRQAGVEVVLIPGAGGRVPFGEIARALGARGFTSVLVEGGGIIAAQALAARVVDRMVVFVAPAVLGADGVPAVAALGITRAADAPRLLQTRIRRVGNDVVVEGRPHWPRRHPLPLAGSRATVAR